MKCARCYKPIVAAVESVPGERRCPHCNWLISRTPPELREFNGNTINELCELGEKIIDLYAADIRKQVISAGDYNYAESLYLHGDLSGR